MEDSGRDCKDVASKGKRGRKGTRTRRKSLIKREKLRGCEAKQREEIKAKKVGFKKKKL